MQQPLRDYSSFQATATVILGAFVGVLILAPFAATYAQQGKLVLSVIFLAIGASLGLLIGYRRRESRTFFYFSMVAVVVLAMIISNSVTN